MLDKQIDHAIDYFSQHQIKVLAHIGGVLSSKSLHPHVLSLFLPTLTLKTIKSPVPIDPLGPGGMDRPSANQAPLTSGPTDHTRLVALRAHDAHLTHLT